MRGVAGSGRTYSIGTVFLLPVLDNSFIETRFGVDAELSSDLLYGKQIRGSIRKRDLFR